VFPFAQFDSQSMFISVFALILGTILLRNFWEMKKTLPKPKTREYLQHLYKTQASDFGLPNSGNSTQNFNQAETNQSDFQKSSNIEEPTISRRQAYEQFDVELLTLSRQIKAEIDTKIVVLQLMIADADRVLQRFEGHLSHSHQIAMPTPHLDEPDLMQILKVEDTPNSSLHQSGASPHANFSPNDPGDLKNFVVEDPFEVGDFGFDKAMRDLDQLSSSIPTFDAMRSLDSWGTPKSESSGSIPEWDTPLAYPISGYLAAHDRPSPTPQSPDTPTHTALSRTRRRKTTYTNKLLTQAPPQLDALMTVEPVGKMGSKPRRVAGQSSNIEDDSFVPPAQQCAPPVIPKSPPPNAKAILVESAPFLQADIGTDKISVRKAKRHQLQYLIEKGMSAKEIAAHLEMPVGEVELIFSLHKRSGLQTPDLGLQEEASSANPEARIPKPENLSSQRRFKIIKNDGERVTG